MGKRLTLDDAQEYAANKGGKCLSTEYINDATRMAWRCERGHTWDMEFQVIRRGAWCAQCNKYEINSEQLEVIKTIAIGQGGKCLATEYKNNHTHLLFECDQGHQWTAAPRLIKKGNWCPTCAGRIYTIEDMKAIAEKRQGKCLSEKYTNSTTKLLWQCSEGHIWKAIPASIINRRWCPKCAFKHKGENQKNDIMVYQDIAIKNGGKLLTEVYVKCSAPMVWECAKGHIWTTSANTVGTGHWCPYCSGKAKHTIVEMRAFAKTKGGKCLSKKYENIYSKLQWECAEGHQWMASPTNVYHNGTWCRECNNKVCIKNLGKYYKKKKSKKDNDA